jgi:ATP synthase protein I
LAIGGGSGLLLGGHSRIGDMTERQPGDLDKFDAKLKAARERIEGSGTQELASEGTSLGYGFRLSVELLAGLLVGLGLGYVIDGWLGTRPWVMLVLMILGLGGGILNVMRVTRTMEQRAAANDEKR